MTDIPMESEACRRGKHELCTLEGCICQHHDAEYRQVEHDAVNQHAAANRRDEKLGVIAHLAGRLKALIDAFRRGE